MEYIIKNKSTIKGLPDDLYEPDVDKNVVITMNATLTIPEFQRDNAKVFTTLGICNWYSGMKCHF